MMIETNIQMPKKTRLTNPLERVREPNGTRITTPARMSQVTACSRTHAKQKTLKAMNHGEVWAWKAEGPRFRFHTSDRNTKSQITTGSGERSRST